MNEAQFLDGLTSIVDSEKTALKTKQGMLSLRDILTAVYEAQQVDTRWISKFIGKRKVTPELVILHLPDKVGSYINLSEGGKYLGFFNQIVAGLDLLAAVGLLSIEEVWKFDNETDSFNDVCVYGISSLGKAFVNYNEDKKS